MSELPGSSKPSIFGLYKPGQGKWSRGIGAASLVAIGIWAAIETHSWIPQPPPAAGANDLIARLAPANVAGIIDGIDKDGFLARSVTDTTEIKTDNASYVISIEGAGIYLRDVMIWGDALTKQLDSLGGLTGAEGRAGMDKLLTALKEASKDQPAKVPKAPGKPRKADEIAKLVKQMKAAPGDFTVTARYVGPPQAATLYSLTLSTQPPMGDTARAVVTSLRYVVPGVLLLLFVVCAWFVGNRGGATDFIIETETEMKKVTWPTMREVVNATVVVIIVTILLGVFMFLIDRFVLQFLFERVGILPRPH